MNKFTKTFGNKENEIPAVANRYHLIAGLFCPFAHRAVIGRKLLGLEDKISIDLVSPINTPNGLAFSDNINEVDAILGKKSLREVYQNTDQEFEGVPTVPVLLDKETGLIVNKESADILREFATSFKELHKEGAIDIYPEALRTQIDEWSDYIGKYINSGIYRVGFAKEQEEYEKAFTNFFSAMDKIEEHLATTRFMVGNTITEVDIKLYATLVRFDAIYYSLYKANRNRLVDFPNIWNYMRELYQTDGFGNTTDFTIMKKGYYLGTGGLKILKDNGVYPIGDNPELWNEPHTRHNI